VRRVPVQRAALDDVGEPEVVQADREEERVDTPPARPGPGSDELAQDPELRTDLAAVGRLDAADLLRAC
jgi:hypothetical protein